MKAGSTAASCRLKLQKKTKRKIQEVAVSLATAKEISVDPAVAAGLSELHRTFQNRRMALKPFFLLPTGSVKSLIKHLAVGQWWTSRVGPPTDRKPTDKTVGFTGSEKIWLPPFRIWQTACPITFQVLITCPFPNVFSELFTIWRCKMNPTDLGTVPSGMSA